MGAADFNEIFETLNAGVADLAKETMADYIKQASREGQGILTSLKADMERWTAGVASGELAKEDVAFLVAGKRELMELKALQQIGIARIQLDKFRDGLTDLIVGTITRLL